MSDAGVDPAASSTTEEVMDNTAVVPTPVGPAPEEALGADNDSTKSVLERWQEIEAQLLHARELRREGNRVEKEAFAALTTFLAETHEEGLGLAGEYPRIVEAEQEAQAVKEAFIAEKKAKKKRQEEAEEALYQAQVALQRHQLEAHARDVALHNQVRLARIAAAKQTGANVPCCCVCGLHRVARGRECPRREFHKFEKRQGDVHRQ